MNEYIEVEYRKEELEEYVIELLTMGICSLFFRGSFICNRDVLTAAYLSDGYRRLDTLKQISAVDALSVAASLFMGAHQCEKHYIFADAFMVESACVYVKKDFSDVRLLYMPAKIVKSMTEKTADLLLYLADKCSSEGASYLQRASEMIREDRYGYKSVLHQLERLRQEAYMCGIE